MTLEVFRFYWHRRNIYLELSSGSETRVGKQNLTLLVKTNKCLLTRFDPVVNIFPYKPNVCRPYGQFSLSRGLLVRTNVWPYPYKKDDNIYILFSFCSVSKFSLGSNRLPTGIWDRWRRDMRVWPFYTFRHPVQFGGGCCQFGPWHHLIHRVWIIIGWIDIDHHCTCV